MPCFNFRFQNDRGLQTHILLSHSFGYFNLLCGGHDLLIDKSAVLVS